MLSMTSPVGEQEQGSAAPAERQRQRGSSNPVSAILEFSDSRPQSQSQPRQMQHDPRYSAGPEMGHEERRTPPEGEESLRGSNIKRDEGRD
jgi:hypothetical protein